MMRLNALNANDRIEHYKSITKACIAFFKKHYKSVKNGQTNGRTDGWTEGRTDERTTPLIEVRGRI